MFKFVEWLAVKLAPPGADTMDAQVLIWRLGLTAALVVSAVLFGWFLGAFPYSSGVAFADDVDEQVDEKVAAAVAPINKRLGAIELEQTVQSGYLKTLVLSDFAQLINRELLARCGTTSSEERVRINAAIDNYQQQYEAIDGDRYPEPECDEL